MPTTTLSTSAGPVDVPATEPAPGLYVYEAPADVSPTSTHRWILAHHEGPALASFETEGAATTGAHSIAPLADWTRSQMTTAQEISFGGHTEQLGDLLHEAGGAHPNT